MKGIANTERISNLDLVRGVAVLGILVMNAVSYALGTTAYFNIGADEDQSWLDFALGIFGELFVDQKFMAMFSMLFGAGIVLFADRVAAKGGAAGRLSLWRNMLLLVIGIVHSLIWAGDVLVVYAIAAPVLIFARNLRPVVLACLGVGAVLLSVVAAVVAQGTVGADGQGLGEYWLGEGPLSDGVGIFLLVDFFGRAVGMMLLGVALYRTGFLAGAWRPATYRRIAGVGMGIGLSLAAGGVGLVVAADFAPSVAVIGSVPNTLGTIPASLGFVAAITLWGSSTRAVAFRQRLESVGRMALTNYLSQTLIGIVTFKLVWPSLISDTGPTRTVVAGFIVVVWAVQLWWSPRWLARFRYGPAEWLWRMATYRRRQPIRLPQASRSESAGSQAPSKL